MQLDGNEFYWIDYHRAYKTMTANSIDASIGHTIEFRFGYKVDTNKHPFIFPSVDNHVPVKMIDAKSTVWSILTASNWVNFQHHLMV